LIAVLAAALVVVACGGTPPPPNGGGGGTGDTDAGKVYMMSSQGNPIDEAQGMRDKVLSGFKGQATFDSAKTATQQVQQVLSEAKAGKGTVDVLGQLQGDMVTLQNANTLEDLTPLLRKLEKSRTFDPALLKYGRVNGKQYFIPWMQATYMMVANKKALRYLPKGANIDDLSYDQLVQWSANMEEGTGEKKFGLPANTAVSGGLIKRFIEGYMYPSYTGTEVAGFKSTSAVKGWQMVRRLWDHTNKQSPTYSFMQEPLQSGDVWVAWDHQARLVDAIRDTANFVTFPAPHGPKGLGYLPVLAGLAIPRNAPNQKGAEQLIDYLTRPAEQVRTGSVLDFTPVVTVPASANSDPVVKAEAAATSKMVHAKNAIRANLETGLGTQTNAFSDAYAQTFEAIVLRNQDIPSTLSSQATVIQGLLDQAKAPCWPPDKPSSGTCQIQ
jgi:multiple sugar transport system substrate-binding protein